jgi:hypothetical protein
VNTYFAGFGHSEVSLYILEQNKQAYLLTHYKLLDLHYEIVVFFTVNYLLFRPFNNGCSNKMMEEKAGFQCYPNTIFSLKSTGYN